VRADPAHADEFKVDTHRVGIMGSSAGGHLASTLLTHFDAGDANATDTVDRQSSRPDLGILCYAVITMGDATHHGSRDNLLGKTPDREQVELLSNELQVTANTPPCFLWTTFDDKTVPMENTMLFAEALRKNHVPFDLHVYQKGAHGMGLKDKAPFANPHPWANDCLFWLKLQNFAN
jgi:acetyl esterase/lipase